MKFSCTTHGVSLTIDGKIRRIEPPTGSYGNPCKLLTMHPVAEGKFDDCEIVKEQES